MTALLLGIGLYLSFVGLETLLLFTAGEVGSAVVTYAAERSSSRSGKTYLYYYRFVTSAGVAYQGRGGGSLRQPLGFVSIPVLYLPTLPEINRPDLTQTSRILLVSLYLVSGLAAVGVAVFRLRRFATKLFFWGTMLSGILLGLAAYGIDRTLFFISFPGDRSALEVAPSDPGFAFANLKEGGNFAKAGDWVYFAPFRGGQLCRARPDGSEPSVLLDRPVSHINVADRRLLFLQFVPRQGDLLFELPLEGGRPRTLLADSLAEVWVQGDWIYYRPEGQGGQIHRMRLDGSGREQISGDRATSMAVAGGWIYYINETQGRRLYRMRLNGAGREQLGEAGIGEFLIAGEWLFFRNRDDRHLYRMDVEGGEPEPFLDVDARSLNTDGTWLYYSDFGEDARLYRIALDGGLAEPLTRTSARFPHVVGEWLYFGVGGILEMDIFRLPLNRGADPSGPAQPWLAGFPDLGY